MELQGEIGPGPCAQELNSQSFLQGAFFSCLPENVYRYSEIRSACRAEMGMRRGNRLVEGGGTLALSMALPDNTDPAFDHMQHLRDVQNPRRVTQPVRGWPF